MKTTHTEAWIQGYLDAHNWMGYDPNNYDIDDYTKGYETGKDEIHATFDKLAKNSS